MKKLGEIFLLKLEKFEKSWRIMGGGAFGPPPLCKLKGGGPLKNKGGFAPPKGGGGRVVPWPHDKSV